MTLRNSLPRVVFISCGLLMVGCSGPGSSGVDSDTARPVGADGSSGAVSKVATLVANPNPVPGGEGMGSTTISWDTGDGSFGQIYISENDGPDATMFVEGARNSKEAKWIKSGHTYEFRLYAGREHQVLLAKVLVTRGE